MNRSYVIAGLIAAVVLGWVLTGTFVGAGGTGGATPPTAAAAERPARITAVRVQVSKAVPHVRHIVVRGHTEAVRKVEVRSEVDGRIAAVLVDKGSRVKPGDALARLATEDRAAFQAEAVANARQRQIEYDAAKSLHEKGFRGEARLLESAAQLEAARARVKQMEMAMEHLTLRAPFAGIVEQRPAELGAWLKQGSPVATIVDENPFLVVGQVSERDVTELAAGQPGQALLITGQEARGRIRFIGASADPATRTFRLELEVPNPDGRLKDGLTAEIRLPTAAVMAHRISPAALTLNDQGIVGIRAIDAAEVVHFHPARIIADGPDGVWLGGLPERLEVIVVGQEFVRDGDKVAPDRGRGEVGS